MAHPDLVNCNAVAVSFVQIMRDVVYQHPRLFAGGGVDRDPEGSNAAKKEQRKRDRERKLFEELSRYYPLERGRTEWRRPLLLKRGKHRLRRSMHLRHSTYSHS